MNSLFQDKVFIKAEKCKKKHCKKESKEFFHYIKNTTTNTIKKCGVNKKCMKNELKKHKAKTKSISEKYKKYILKNCKKEINSAKKLFDKK